MDIYYLKINGNILKNFSSINIALDYIKLNNLNLNTDDLIQIFYEEFIDEIHGSEMSCRVHMVYSNQKKL